MPVGAWTGGAAPRMSARTSGVCLRSAIFQDPFGEFAIVFCARRSRREFEDRLTVTRRFREANVVADREDNCAGKALVSRSPGFPPGGDCTFFFRWGQFDYIIGGFTGLWSKPAEAPNSAYEDMARQGLDFYDGLGVPAITGVADGRFLMAGWIPIRGWGGNLVIRELVQFPDGRIGSKWMNEITPATEPPKTLAARVAEATAVPADSKSFLLVFDVQPSEAKKGRLGISLLPDSGEQAACELQIRLDDLRAQFGPGSGNDFAGKQKSLREGGSPHGAGNYAIENLIGVDQPFTVRLIVKGDDKIGGSLVDAEIAGRRTRFLIVPS